MYWELFGRLNPKHGLIPNGVFQRDQWPIEAARSILEDKTEDVILESAQYIANCIDWLEDIYCDDAATAFDKGESVILGGITVRPSEYDSAREAASMAIAMLGMEVFDEVIDLLAMGDSERPIKEDYRLLAVAVLMEASAAADAVNTMLIVNRGGYKLIEFNQATEDEQKHCQLSAYRHLLNCSYLLKNAEIRRERQTAYDERKKVVEETTASVQSDEQRHRTTLAKNAATARHRKNYDLKKFVVTEFFKGNFRSPPIGAKSLIAQTQAYAKDIGAPLSAYNAENTIYRWILAAIKEKRMTPAPQE